MLSRITFNVIRAVRDNARVLHRIRDPLQSNFASLYNDRERHCVQEQNSLYIAKRFKSSKRKKAAHKQSATEDLDSDDEIDKSEEDAPVGSKVTTIQTQSIRLDTVSKIGFGMSRNKVEEAFYESKIRVNGEKVLKKAKELNIGDEVDLILRQDLDNPKMLIVNRLVILSMEPAADGVKIKLSKDKNLMIQNYNV